VPPRGEGPSAGGRMNSDPDPECRPGCWCRNTDDTWPPPIGAMSWTPGDPVARFGPDAPEQGEEAA
jgi:hypothetical protein